jgi:succinylarginine dihydrolase
MTTIFHEVQCDGLIGCSHNYAGLSFGNIASERHAGLKSYPRKAALQGLEKMRAVHNLGIPQLILPPPLRPNTALWERFGLPSPEALAQLPPEHDHHAVLRASYSASTMWSANAATVSPAPDTEDGALHLTIANLASSLHRSQEAAERYAQFRTIFGNVATVHEALPACTPLTDEGAANHMRLCPAHGEAGIELFIYGRDEAQPTAPARFPARQTKRASAAIAHVHHLPERRTVLAQQHPHAIDAGVFHNDVIAMSNENLLIYHEYTFLDEATTLAELRRKADFPLILIRLSEGELPLRDAVTSYFYNSQLLTHPEGGMIVLAPREAEANSAARIAFDRVVQAPDNPIHTVQYMDVRESMQNGGGPACLRLRVVMREEDLERIPAPYRFTEARYEALCAFITARYPETIAPEALYDTAFQQQMHSIHGDLLQHFNEYRKNTTIS